MKDIEIFELRDPCEYGDWHAVVTIQLGELIESGVIDFSDESFDFDSYDDEQRDRLYRMLQEHYYWREIGVLPVLRWKRELVRKLNELMQKYRWLYQAEAEGIDPLQESGEYGKRRDVFSDFPQTLLGGNQDYASNGTDNEFETIRQGDYLRISDAIRRGTYGIDTMLVEDLECMFSCLLTSNVNGIY